mgnify:CR=1 FL=1
MRFSPFFGSRSARTEFSESDNFLELCVKSNLQFSFFVHNVFALRGARPCIQWGGINQHFLKVNQVNNSPNFSKNITEELLREVLLLKKNV